MGRYLRVFASAILLLVVLGFLMHPGKARYEVAASVSQPPPLAPQAALGTGFTYQGELRKDGAPVTAICSLTFSLWDAAGDGAPPVGGSQIGVDQTIDPVDISNGLFTVILNENGEFGAEAFNGEARWLQIGVACPAAGATSILSPRQPVTPAPYALSARSRGYRNVRVVARGGGDYTSVQAALDSILDASAQNPYLVWIAPGVYTETVTMKPYVDLEGAGQLVTKITSGGSGSSTTGTVVAASNAELRSLTVENTGGAVYAIAIYSNDASPSLTDITATATGDGNISAAVFSDNNSAPVIRDATLLTSGAGFSHYTLYTRGSTNNKIYNSTLEAYGGSIQNYGVLSVVNSTTAVYSSMIWGTTSAAHMLNSAGRIATSQLVGGVSLEGTGTIVCVGNYDQSFVALDFNCQ